MTRYLLDVEVFGGYYCLDWLRQPSPPMHREIYQILSDDSKRYVAISAWRGSGKSAVICIDLAFRAIVQKLNMAVIISDTSTMACQRLREIKNLIENDPAIRRDFGDHKSNLWNIDHIKLVRKDGSTCEIRAIGADSQSRGWKDEKGRRPDLIICDDLENDTNVRSDEQRQKLLDWFQQAVLPSLDTETGRIVVIGTLLHPESLLAKLLASPSWYTRTFCALLPDGSAAWPEKFSVEFLAEQKERIGAQAFAAEYMNQPMVSGNPIFHRQWFRRYDPTSLTFRDTVARGVRTVLSVDPASSLKGRADYTAISIVSATVAADPDYYIRRADRGHWTIHETVHRIIGLYRDYKASSIIVEATAYQEVLAQELRRVLSEQNTFIPVVSVKPDKVKERRALEIAPLFERALVHFPDKDFGAESLETELVLFPTGANDDQVDALVMSLAYLRGVSKGGAVATGQRVLPKGAVIDPITGVVR